MESPVAAQGWFSASGRRASPVTTTNASQPGANGIGRQQPNNYQTPESLNDASRKRKGPGGTRSAKEPKRTLSVDTPVPAVQAHTHCRYCTALGGAPTRGKTQVRWPPPRRQLGPGPRARAARLVPCILSGRTSSGAPRSAWMPRPCYHAADRRRTSRCSGEGPAGRAHRGSPAVQVAGQGQVSRRRHDQEIKLVYCAFQS
jgi:hypothetical protein